MSFISTNDAMLQIPHADLFNTHVQWNRTNMDSNVLVVKCRKWNIIGIIYSVHYVSRISELAISYFLFIVSTNVIVTKHHVVFNDLRLLLFIIIIILKWQMPNTLHFYVFLSPNRNKKLLFGLKLMTNWC